MPKLDRLPVSAACMLSAMTCLAEGFSQWCWLKRACSCFWILRANAVVAVLTVLGSSFSSVNGAVERDLSLLWYTLNTCEYSGQTGPPYLSCKEHYSQNSSPVAPHLLPPFIPVEGIQRFRLPRTGRYSIVASGGGGGKGVCRSTPGASPVLELTLNFSDRLVLEVVVGHRGTDACASSLDDPICNSTLTLAQCRNMWLSRVNGVRLGDGGGGGGGATLIRPRQTGDFSSEVGQSNIALLVGGGGGAESLSTTAMAPSYSVNGTVNRPSGGSGSTGRTLDKFKQPATGSNIAGPGGGVQSTSQATSAHGKGFNPARLEDFAKGGDDALRNQLDGGLSINTVGGYGGGGGASASGGGGGGFDGGNSYNDATDHYPGGGGSSFHSVPVNQVNHSDWNLGHGFVMLRHENCGCAGDCVVNSNRSVFWCTCPDNTTLGADGYDCHKEESIVLSTAGRPLREKNLTSFGLVQFYSANFSLSSQRDKYLKQVLSAEATVTVEEGPVGNTSSVCGLLFLSRTQEIVASLHLFPYMTGGTRVSSLSAVRPVYSTTGGTSYSVEASVEMLNASVELHSLLLYQTTGLNCAFSSMAVNTSVEELFNAPGSLPNNLVLSDDNITNFFTGLKLLSPNATPTTNKTTTDDGPVYIYILIAVLGSIVIVTVIVLVVVIVWTVTNRKSRYKRTVQNFRAQVLSDDQMEMLRQIQEQTSGPRPRKRTRKASFKRTSRSMSTSTNVRDDLRVSQMNSAYADLIVPEYGVDLDDLPPDIDFAVVNYARITANDNEWHIPRETLSYMRELGQGEFGKVLLMQAKCICGYEGSLPVAVKTLSHEKMKDIDKFMEEVHLMKRFTHPNIVSLLGYCPAESDGAPMMILELMKYGDLQSFLQSNRPVPNTVGIISHAEFFHFALDISKALEFLASQSYVHRDIAARNCLVGEKLVVKLADFGLARDIHGKDYYRIAGQAKLPVKWMAPESLLYGQFTQATDVWSFGVLLWETTSYGLLPLPSYTVEEVVNLASRGELFHDRPEHCPDGLYSVMQQCLQIDYNMRPTFCDLRVALQDLCGDDVRLTERNRRGTSAGEYAKRSPSPADSINNDTVLTDNGNISRNGTMF